MQHMLILYSAVYVLIGFSFVCISAAVIYWKEIRNSSANTAERNWPETFQSLVQLVGFALIWPLVLGVGIWTLIDHLLFENRGELRETQEDETPWLPGVRQLQTKMTVAEAERSGLVHDPLGAVPEIPFGHLNRRWVEFRGALAPDAPVWWFETKGKDRWKREHFARGYAFRTGWHVERIFLTEFRPVELYDWE